MPMIQVGKTMGLSVTGKMSSINFLKVAISTGVKIKVNAAALAKFTGGR